MSKIEKFFRDPTAFFRDAANNRRATARTGTPTYVVGFSTWKQYMRKFFPERNLNFLPREISEHEFKLVWEKKILSDRRAEIFIWGFKAPPYILEFIKKNRVKAVFVEDGFVRSVQLGASKAPPMSLCLDTKTPYFNARVSSDLEVMLNTYDFIADPALLQRAERAIALLVTSGVSKYNNATPVDIASIYGNKQRKRVLVIGQVEDDASIEFGCEQKLSNNDVVRIAAKENPGAQIIYKPHPDVLGGHRPLQSDPSEVANICQLLTQRIPMGQALATIDHVYTITSLAGFEAVIRGIKTTTLGAPFYSGWGLTDDRQATARRTKKLSVNELFAGAYLLYPQYFDPESGAKLTLEDVISKIQSAVKLHPESADTAVSDHKLVVAKTVPIAQVKPLLTTTYLVGDVTYEALLGTWFAKRRFIHIPAETTNEQFVSKFKKTLDGDQYAEFFVAPGACSPYLRRQVQASGKKIAYLSEGFLGSFSLGNDKVPPVSLILDSRTPHYDGRHSTDLEILLSTYDFDADEALMSRSRSVQSQLLQSGLSKYNHVDRIPDIEAVLGVKNRTRILVLGQIDSAESARLSNPKGYSNKDLVMIAAMENPEAQIIFKPHPEALNDRRFNSFTSEISHLCDVVKIGLPIAQALETTDHVYCISSLGGFEAMLRGIKTTTLGAPFYAGWGLGDHREKIDRRQRELTFDQLFAGAYLLYPIYIDSLYKTKTTAERAIARLNDYVSSRPSVAADDVSPRKSIDVSKPIPTYAVGDANFRKFLGGWFEDRKFGHIPAGTTDQEFSSKFKRPLDVNNRSEFFVLGKTTSALLKKYLVSGAKKVTYVDTGFVHSVAIDTTEAIPHSLLLDREAPCYDATQASDLESLLNTYDFVSDSALKDRSALATIQFLESGLSKYNRVRPVENLQAIYGPKLCTRILVLGQMESSDAVKLANPRGYSNSEMVRIAAAENPGAQIIFKPHPDAFKDFAKFSLSLRPVAHLCELLEVELPLPQAFETIDHVYTISSLGGFEALLRAIPTTTLGVPFYAGWGLADDRQSTPRRTRKLTIQEVFSAAYLIYPVYVDPLYKMQVSFETVVKKLKIELRDRNSATPLIAAGSGKPDPKLEKLWSGWIKFGSWQDESKPIAFAFGFNPWRFTQMAAYLPEYRLAFHDVASGARETTSVKPFFPLFDACAEKVFVILGMKAPLGLQSYLEKNAVDVIRAEDGFIRGIGLGAELSPPLSLVLDKRGMYFDARTPSDLEHILNTFDFAANPALMQEAARCMDIIRASRSTKYNTANTGQGASVYGEKCKPRVLVIGQVENDASIQFGCDRAIDNNGLVMLAALENPEAQIIYKPHPDVLRGNRKFLSSPKEVENISTVIYEPMGIHDALDTIDHVYTITSLAGFEALLRGIPVTTFGAPFYAGWGATDTRQRTPRRGRTLSTTEIFAGAYLLYMKYRHPLTSEVCDLRTALGLLEWMKTTRTTIQPKFSTDVEVAKQHHRIFQRRMEARRFEEAYDEISSAVKLDPDNHAYLLARGKLLLAKGEISERTKDDLRAAVVLAGKSTTMPLKSLISFMWSNEGITSELLALTKKLNSDHAKIDAKTTVWIAAIFTDAGYFEEAADLYLDALQKNPLIVSRQRYLSLLYHVGMLYPEKIHNIDRVRLAYQNMEANRGKFGLLCGGGKRVAVVGNSPCELGKGMGALIDAHDIVIRFNNFSTDHPFNRDYGSKTNIWVKTGMFETVSRRQGAKFELIVQPAGHLPAASSHGVDVVWSAMLDGCSMEFIPRRIKYELVKKLQATPSAGLLVLYWLYSLNGPLDRNSVFGFSMTDQPEGGHTSYHSAPDNGSYKHNWHGERGIFDQLFRD